MVSDSKMIGGIIFMFKYFLLLHSQCHLKDNEKIQDLNVESGNTNETTAENKEANQKLNSKQRRALKRKLEMSNKDGI